jgi:hypothetical protein
MAKGISAQGQFARYQTAAATNNHGHVTFAFRWAPALNSADVFPIAYDFAASSSCHPMIALRLTRLQQTNVPGTPPNAF